MSERDDTTVLSRKILGKTWEKASDMERRVLQSIASRHHISRPMHREMREGLPLGDRLADRVASFGGSWTFITIFFALLIGWMVLNSLILLGRAFDPYPYILLNLVLSCLASVQAPVILMSQNRQAANDRAMAAHDYEVNLKAEIEIMQLHEKLEILRQQDLGRMLQILEHQMKCIEDLTRPPDTAT